MLDRLASACKRGVRAVRNVFKKKNCGASPIKGEIKTIRISVSIDELLTGRKYGLFHP